jgi:putative serine protease PepD
MTSYGVARTVGRGGWSRPRLLPALPGLAAAALLLAGCGIAGGRAPAPQPTVSPSVLSLQQQFVQVVRQVGPSVVLIRTDKGLGSGVIFDSGGDIVTNNHVVAGASGFQVVLTDGAGYPARLVGSVPADDLAVLHIAAPELHPAVFADSSAVSVGDIPLAIGNPLGLQSSVTEGIVSALNRTVTEDGGVTLPDVIQTSAAINPGNSGGALVDLQGRVIGIPTLAATDPQLGAVKRPASASPLPATPYGRSPCGSSTTRHSRLPVIAGQEQR